MIPYYCEYTSFYPKKLIIQERLEPRLRVVLVRRVFKGFRMTPNERYRHIEYLASDEEIVSIRLPIFVFPRRNIVSDSILIRYVTSKSVLVRCVMPKSVIVRSLVLVYHLELGSRSLAILLVLWIFISSPVWRCAAPVQIISTINI